MQEAALPPALPGRFPRSATLVTMPGRLVPGRRYVLAGVTSSFATDRRSRADPKGPMTLVSIAGASGRRRTAKAKFMFADAQGRRRKLTVTFMLPRSELSIPGYVRGSYLTYVDNGDGGIFLVSLYKA